MDIEKYRALFVEEAADHLTEMSHALAALESRAGGDAGEAIDTLFRMAHSIKGMAASLDYGPLADLAHRLEDWLQPMREAGLLPDEALPSLYLVLGALEEMVATVARNGSPPPAREDVLAALNDPADLTLAARLATPAPVAEAGVRSKKKTVAPPPALPRSVRVRADAIDRFLASVGQLMERQARLETLHRGSPMWAQRAEFDEELAAMERVVRELRRRALDVRTTAVRRVLERLPRVAAELARALDKRVEVRLEGDEVEVDRAVLDHLDDALLHLVRNAVDHGLETPARRTVMGKDPIGSILIRASRVAGRLHLRLEDDGAGIDVEAARHRAVEHGLLPEAVAEDLPAERVLEYLFEPGMSTKREVSEISGRGVGLDAVKRQVEALGGSISLSSDQGRGTVFEIDLPSMVALQRVLILQIAGGRVALPVGRVEAVVDVREGTVEGVAGEAFFVWKDEPMPLLDLSQRLVGRPAPDPTRGCVVVLETQGFRHGLRVERANSSFEVFVREVPAPLSQIKPLVGVAILMDGAPVFLLEPSALVEDFV